MNNEEFLLTIIKNFKKQYPNSKCMLNHSNSLELLIATRLSAQCKDERVNKITPILFSKYKDMKEFANANVEDISNIIKPCGLYKTKANDIVNMCKMLIEDFGGTIPDSIENLTLLPGVGRKTANLIMGEVFKKPAIIVDTHCIRVTKRLGLHSTNNPIKIEKILKELLPDSETVSFCHRIVNHGREVCTARKANCKCCCLSKICPSYK